jgi:hypothetical protein
MVRYLALALLAVSGCSLLDWSHLESDGANGDMADAGPSTDAGPGESDATSDHEDASVVDGGPRCDMATKFSTPVVVLGAPTAGNGNVGSAFLTADMLTLVFARDDGNGNNNDLFASTRGTTTDPFPTAVPLSTLNVTVQNDVEPVLTHDGLTIYFSRSPPNGNAVLMTAKRAGLSTWDFTGLVASPINELLSDSRSVGSMQLLDDGTTFYFTDYYNTVVYRTVAASGAFTAATKVNGLLPESVNARFTNDERLVVYSVRGGPQGDQIYTAERGKPGDAFGTPTPIDELNTSADDYPTWMSTDGCKILIVSNQSGRRQLYFATR